MLKKILYPGILFLICIILSCGYRFTPGGENIKPEIQKVYIDNIANNTSEANIENIFRNAFNDRFRTTSRFKLAENQGSSDAVLKSSIINLSTSHLSYSSGNVAKEDRVTVTLDVVFEESNHKVIWANKGFVWYEDYLIDQNNPAVTDANRRAAIQKLAVDTADRIYRAIMSGF